MRDQEALKGEAELGIMGKYVSYGALEELEARIVMQSYCDKQDANCHHKQSHISHS